MPPLNTYLLHTLADPDQLAGGIAVMIDVLRASTTINQALAAGAKEVLPCLEIDDAQRLAAELPAGTYLLGGERRGGKIEGFDLGNSPSEYSPANVAGKSIVFTTTNGTRAIHTSRLAHAVLVGSFTNAHM